MPVLHPLQTSRKIKAWRRKRGYGGQTGGGHPFNPVGTTLHSINTWLHPYVLQELRMLSGSHGLTISQLIRGIIAYAMPAIISIATDIAKRRPVHKAPRKPKEPRSPIKATKA